jgi:hypothetical protein
MYNIEFHDSTMDAIGVVRTLKFNRALHLYLLKTGIEHWKMPVEQPYMKKAIGSNDTK